ncbi:hypothetical protein ACFQX7_34605 [Luedemannella flava]
MKFAISGPEEEADPQEQLAAASLAVRDAYRDTTRLIRLLTVIGTPPHPRTSSTGPSPPCPRSSPRTSRRSPRWPATGCS